MSDYIKLLKVGQEFKFNIDDSVLVMVGFNYDSDHIEAIDTKTHVLNYYSSAMFTGSWASATILPTIATESEVEALKEKAHARRERVREEQRLKKEAAEKEKEAVAADPQYAHLTPYFSTWPVEAAKNIRKTLKKHYGKEVKFSVRVTHHTTITIKPSKKIDMKELREVTRPYELGTWNGMTDSYDYSDSAFCDVFGGVMCILLHKAD